MVSPAGVEPATCPLGGGCAIQLCHGDMGVSGQWYHREPSRNFFKSPLTVTVPYIKARRNSLSNFPLRTFLFRNQLNERYAPA